MSHVTVLWLGGITPGAVSDLAAVARTHARGKNEEETRGNNYPGEHSAHSATRSHLDLCSRDALPDFVSQ